MKTRIDELTRRQLEFVVGWTTAALREHTGLCAAFGTLDRAIERSKEAYPSEPTKACDSEHAVEGGGSG